MIHQYQNKALSAISMALHLEPYLDKKGAVNQTINLGHKRFEEFIYSSSFALPFFIEIINKTRDPLECLVKMVSTEFITKTRMWGALELLAPYVHYKLYDASYLDFSEYLEEQDNFSVQHLDSARFIVWKKSDKWYKKNYEFIGGGNVLDHYKRLEKYGQEIKVPNIYNWCQEIIGNLAIVQEIFNQIHDLKIQEIPEVMPKIWDETIAKHAKHSIGALADYTVLALFDFFML